MTPNTGARTPKTHEIAQPLLVTPWWVPEVGREANYQTVLCIRFGGVWRFGWLGRG